MNIFRKTIIGIISAFAERTVKRELRNNGKTIKKPDPIGMRIDTLNRQQEISSETVQQTINQKSEKEIELINTNDIEQNKYLENNPNLKLSFKDINILLDKNNIEINKALINNHGDKLQSWPISRLINLKDAEISKALVDNPKVKLEIGQIVALIRLGDTDINKALIKSRVEQLTLAQKEELSRNIFEDKITKNTEFMQYKKENPDAYNFETSN